MGKLYLAISLILIYIYTVAADTTAAISTKFLFYIHYTVHTLVSAFFAPAARYRYIIKRIGEMFLIYVWGILFFAARCAIICKFVISSYFRRLRAIM